MKIDPSRLNLSSLIAGGAAITAAVVVISFFILKGLVGKLSLNNELISKKRQAQKQLTANLESLESLRKEYDALGPKRRLIYDALPATANFPSIVSMMESLSKNAGVGLLSISSATGEQPVSESGPSTYEFSANIKGGYDSFKSFLRNVELSVRPLAITSMTISGSSGTLSVETKIRTYFQSEFDTALKTVPLRPTQASSGQPSGTAPSVPGGSSLNPAQGVSQ